MKMSLGRLSWQRHKKCQTKQGAKSLLLPQRDPGGHRSDCWWELGAVGSHRGGPNMPWPLLGAQTSVGAGLQAAATLGHDGRPPSPFERKHGPAAPQETRLWLQLPLHGAGSILHPGSLLHPGSRALLPAGAGEGQGTTVPLGR